MRELEIPARKISVIHNHLDPMFQPLTGPERATARAGFFGDAEYVVIHVGKASAYKNRLGAIKAFELLRRRLPAARMFLVHGPASREERDFVAESGCKPLSNFCRPSKKAHCDSSTVRRTCCCFRPSTRDLAGPRWKLWEPVVR